MVLPSLPARLLRKCVAALAIFIGFLSISCFGQPVFLPVPATPYDRQMTRVYPTLTSASMQWSGPISLLVVSQWMTALRAMPYQYSGHWQTPAEVDVAQAADCKGKAVALYAQMRQNGAKNVRVVIGKHHLYDTATHAWLEWETAGGTYTLDPTFNETPIKTAELDPLTYLRLYAYDGARKYRIGNAGFLAPTSRVATGYSNHIYIPASTGTTFARPGFTGVGARPFYPATTQYLNTPRPMLSSQQLWSGGGSLSSPNTGVVRGTGIPVVNPNTHYLASAHPIVATSRKIVTHSVRRHSVANAKGRKRRTPRSGAVHRQASKSEAVKHA
jgi:hypothetical protein